LPSAKAQGVHQVMALAATVTGSWFGPRSTAMPPAKSQAPTRPVAASEPVAGAPHCGTSRTSPPQGIDQIVQLAMSTGSPPARVTPSCGPAVGGCDTPGGI